MNDVARHPCTMSRDITVRREWDSNPRWVAPHTLSKRADSAALASLLGWYPGRVRLSCGLPVAAGGGRVLCNCSP